MPLQTEHNNAMHKEYCSMKTNCEGFSLPLLAIIIVFIVVLTYFFGWIVILYVVAIVLLTAAGTALYDKITHDVKCRYCNIIKDELITQRGINRDSIKTIHEKDYSDYMRIQTYIDREMDILVNIDYNGIIIDSHSAVKTEDAS